jgi:23S rRNA pseudouridine1911/1915/1917 synthase
MARAIPVLFEDDHLVALVKPVGLPTANAPRGAESLFTWLQDRRGAGPVPYLGIVSRLDAPVSGIVVVAKTSLAAASLARQFRERTVEKQYWAVVSGRFPAPLGQWIDWHDEIGREDAESGANGGSVSRRPAHVRCRVVRRAGEVSLVELAPSTGRRHQLRMQLSSRGCPIVGDKKYGSRLPFAGGGIALHAQQLGFDHPASGTRQTIQADVTNAWRPIFPSLFPAGGRR